jgi:hypothetical protein
MKRILPLLVLVIGAVWYFFFRDEAEEDYGYGGDEYEEDRYEDDGGALKAREAGG